MKTANNWKFATPHWSSGVLEFGISLRLGKMTLQPHQAVSTASASHRLASSNYSAKFTHGEMFQSRAREY